MDRDTADRFMAEGSYRFAKNVRIHTSNDDKAGFATPIGAEGPYVINAFSDLSFIVCIGAFEDIRDNTVYAFYVASDGIQQVDLILRFEPSTPPHVIMRGTLYFDPSSPMVSCSFVGDELGFTNSNEMGWKIHIDKAYRANRSMEWELYFDSTATGLFTNGQQLYITATDANGNVLVNNQLILDCDGLFEDDIRTALLNIQTVLDGGGFDGSRITEKGIIFGYTDGPQGLGGTQYESPNITISAVGGLDFKLVRYNSYPDVPNELCLKRAKRPPVNPPTTQFVYEEDRATNTLFGTTPLFQVQYLYKGGEKSSWGPISTLPSQENFLSASEYAFNAIDVTFNDPLLTDESFCHDILAVNIGVRFSNEGDLFLAKTLKLSEIGITNQTFRFYNDEVYTVVDPAESEKLFDSVPYMWEQEEGFASKNGEGERIALANYVEGYDNVPVNVELSLNQNEINVCSGTYDIDFTVEIRNAANTLQPIYWDTTSEQYYFGGFDTNGVQGNTNMDATRIPLKGFVGYLAGTNYKAITVQNHPDDVTVHETENNAYAVDTQLKRDAIVTAQGNNEVFSTGKITGVKPGRYILRLASNYCNDGEGGAYDIQSASFQDTSTLVASAEGNAGQREILLNLPAIPANTTQTVDAGTFVVDDPFTSSTDAESRVVTGYVVDSDGDLDRAEIAKALTMENQEVELHITAGIGNNFIDTVYSDHNGFFYDIFSASASVAARIDTFVAKEATASGVNIKTLATPSGQLFIGQADNYFVGDYYDLRRANQLENNTPNPDGYDYYLKSGFHDSILPVLGTPTPIVPIYTSKNNLDLVVVSENTQYQTHYTDVEITILNQDSVPLQGVTFALERTGRAVRSGNNGVARIRAYAPNTGTSRGLQQIQIGNDTVSCFDDDSTYPVEFTLVFGAGNFNSTNPYQANYLLDVVSPPSNLWKHGDTIHFGLVYYDEWGRSGGVCTADNMTVRIPFYGETANAYFGQSIQWEIYHPAPSWATHYQWVRTKGTLFGRYTQIACDGAEYVQSYDPNTDTYTYVNYGGPATEVHLDFQTISNTNKVSPSVRLGYEYVPGDRVRLVRFADGTHPTEYYNAKLQGQIGDKIVMEYDTSWPEIKPGDLLEIYTPAPNTDTETRIYYECSQVYSIAGGTPPLTPLNVFYNARHNGAITNQFGQSPATGQFPIGNVYVRQRKFMIEEGQTQIYSSVEDSNWSDFYPSEVQSIGRPNAVNPFAKAYRWSNSIRFSNKYYSDSASGTSSFEALNAKNFPEEIAGFKALVFFNNVLVAIGSRRTISIYVGESQITTGSGENIISLNREVLGAWNMAIGQYGTIHPLSVARSGSSLYFVDAINAKIIRFGANGMTPISDYGIKQYLLDIMSNASNVSAFGAYDTNHDEYVVQIAGTGFSDAIAFSERANAWTSTYTMSNSLKGLAMTGRRQLIMFDTSTVSAFDFQAAKLPAEIDIVVNKNPLQEKNFENIAIDCKFQDGGTSDTWSVDPISVITSDNIEQESNLVEGDFVLIRGQYTSPFWRDINSGGLVNGDQLRGVVMNLKLQTSNTADWELRGIEVSYGHSDRNI